MYDLCTCFSLRLGLNIRSACEISPTAHRNNTHKKNTTCARCLNLKNSNRLVGWLFKSSRQTSWRPPSPACFSSCPKMQAHPISCVLGFSCWRMARDISWIIDISWQSQPLTNMELCIPSSSKVCIVTSVVWLRKAESVQCSNCMGLLPSSRPVWTFCNKPN